MKSLISFLIVTLSGLIILLNCANQQLQVTTQQPEDIQIYNQTENYNDAVKEVNPLEKIVLEYCSLAKTSKFLELKKLITYTPESYWKYLDRKTAEKFPELAKGDQQNLSGSTNANNSKVLLLDMKPFEDYEFEKLKKEFPQIFIEMRKLDDERIIKSWEKDNEGRVRIEFKSKLSPSIYEVDFYLYKGNDENWKIFKVDTLVSDEETYPI